jgi:hypothetical protein
MRQFRPDKYRSFVRRNSVAVTVYRRQPDNDQYGTTPEYSELSSQRQLLIAGENEVPQSTAAGQIESIAMSAYSLPETDVQVGDRIDHGSGRLEVVSAHDMPSEQNAGITKYELEDA